MAQTGYRPKPHLFFNGCEERFELWEVKLNAHLSLQKLLSVITGARDKILLMG